MKARINMSKDEKKICKQYVSECLQKERYEMLMRFLKINCVVLHNEFNFGTQRLEKFINSITSTMDKNANEVFWDRVDETVIDKLKLPFEREDYEERENAMRANARKR